MPESTPTPAPNPPERDPSAPEAPAPTGNQAAKRKRRRRWPWIVGGILVLILLFVLLAPTLLSMGGARSLVVGQINHRLNGRIDVKDWSLGWISPMRVDGLVIYDDSDRQILQLPHLGTQLTLASLIRGNYDAGKVDVDGLDLLVVRELDGSLNWDRLFKTAAKAPAQPSSESSGKTKSSRLPQVHAELALNSCSTTYEDKRQSRTVHLRAINAAVKVSDINQPITDTLSAQAQVNDGPVGTVSMGGSIEAVKNNVVAIDTANVEQTLDLKGVDLKSISALLGPSLALVGNSTGHCVVQLKNGKDGAIEANLASSGFGASGESLGGGALRSDSLSFNLPRTSIRAPAGIDNFKNLQVQIGGSLADAVTLKLKNASVVEGQGAAARQVLNGYDLSLETAANYASTAQGASLAVTRLSLTDNQSIVSLTKPADQDLAVVLPTSGDPQAKGDIHLAADLARLNGIARAIKGPQISAQGGDEATLRSGKLQGDVSLAQAGPGQIQLTGKIDVTSVTFARGNATPVQNQNVQLALKVLANHDLSQIEVPQLDVNAPELQSTVGLVQPIVVSNAAGLSQLFSSRPSGAANTANASMSGRILFRGNPGPIMALKDAWSAQASEHQYGGGYAIDEQLATNPSGQITVVGRADLNDLTIDGQPYPEKALRVLSNLSLDLRNEVLGLDSVSLLSTTTNALNIVLKGRFIDFSNQRRIENVLTADLGYDGAALWKMIVPLLSKETQQTAKDYVVAGKYQKQFQVRGSYPANKPFNEAVQSLTVAGALVLDQFAARGADLRQLTIPVDLHGGVMRIAYAGKPTGQDLPPAAILNGGTLTIGGASADLRQPHIRVSTPPNTRFIDHITLNPIFASTYLGDYLNNPVFVGANQATGILNINIVQCEGLALDDALKTGDSGKAVLDLSLDQLHIGNELIAKILGLAGASDLKNSLQGDVKNYHIVIDRGVIHHDMVVTLAEANRPLHVFGDVRLSDNEMMPMTIDLPWALFAVGKNSQLKQYLPQGIQIPLRGKPTAPSFALDVNQLVQKTLVDAGQKALKDNVLKSITGQKSETTQPADQNPLQQLEDLLNKKKDKKKQ